MESWRLHVILLQIMLLLVLLALPAVADCDWSGLREDTHHYEGNYTSRAYKDTFKDGDTAPYKCQSGYAVSGLYSGPHVLNATCRGDKWVYDPRNLVCKAISCGHPCPGGSCRNGDVSPPVFNFPGGVKFTCKQGYHLVAHDDQYWDPKNTVYCKSDGKWSRPAPKCVEVRCPQPPPIGNGQVSPQQPIFRENDVVQYTCNQPYTLVGDATRRCQNNVTWSGDEPTCEKRCPPPVLPYGEIKTNGDYGVGAHIIYVCDDGKRGAAGCGEDLKWHPDPPLCTDTKQKSTPAPAPPPRSPPTTPTTTASTPSPPTQCSPLSSPTSGKLFSSDGFRINASVFFTCDEGYTLQGPATLICRPTGIWDPLTTPTCTAPPPWIIILSVCLAVLASLVLCCLGFFYIMRRRRRRTPPPRSYRRQIRKPGPYDAISNDEVARLGKPFPVTSL